MSHWTPSSQCGTATACGQSPLLMELMWSIGFGQVIDDELMIFFFFFLETGLPEQAENHFITGRSDTKILWISEGTEFIQTKTGKENLTHRARACANSLPCRHVWEKEEYCKVLTEDIMSLTKWPTSGCWKHWFLNAKIDSSESPSRIEPRKPSSRMKRATLLAAIVSRATIDEGMRIILDKAARTSLEEFRTTAPIPATPKSSKTAPSKFVFNKPASGGFQMTFLGNFFVAGFTRCR